MKKPLLMGLGIFLMVFSPLVFLSTIAYTMAMPRLYEVEAKIALHEDRNDVDAFIRDGKEFVFNPLYFRSQIAIMESRQILDKVVDNLALQKVWGKKINEDHSPLGRELAVHILAEAVKVEPFRDTSLIAVRVRMEDGHEAALVANEIVRVYGEYRLAQKRSQRTQGYETRIAELTRQQESVNKAEEELLLVRKELKLSTGSNPAAADPKKLAALQANVVAARVDMLARKTRVEQLKKLTGDDLLTAHQFIVGDPSLNSLHQRLTDAERALKTKLESLGENHPDVRQLKSDVDELRARLRVGLNGMKTGLEADYHVSQARYEELEKEINALSQSQMAMRPQDYLSFNKAERKLEDERAVWMALKSRLTHTEDAKNPPHAPVEIIDPAQPTMVTVSPNLFLNITVAIVVAGGLFLAGLISLVGGVVSGRKKHDAH